MEGAIRYKITIEAVVQREEFAGKEWKPTTTAPGADYAYTPQIKQVVVRNIDVFTQQVETLDLQSVIAAINKMRLAP